jgi:hypothetical protein
LRSGLPPSQSLSVESWARLRTSQSLELAIFYLRIFRYYYFSRSAIISFSSAIFFFSSFIFATRYLSE